MKRLLVKFSELVPLYDFGMVFEEDLEDKLEEIGEFLYYIYE